MYSNGLHHAVSLGNFEVETISAGQRQHMHRNCDSDDENTMRRRRMHQMSTSIESNPRSSIYSKGDIQEQYCLTDRQLHTVERSRRARFLGCLSKCATSQSILAVCVGRRAPSDENLATYAPFYRYPRYPHQVAAEEMLGVNSSFRRQPASILSSSRAQDENVRSTSRTSWQDHNEEIFGNDASTKHVSFARSHTLTCFDDVNMEYYTPYRYDESRSQERLIGGKTVARAYVSPTGMTLVPTPSQYCDHSCGHAHFQHSHLHSCVPASCCNSAETQTKYNIGVLPCPMNTARTVTPEIVVIESKKRNTMKTQATQTEIRSSGLPNVLNLSPRTTQKVKVVSQSAQTNGIESSRKHTKSLSEMPSDPLELKRLKVKLNRQTLDMNDEQPVENLKRLEDYYRPAPPMTDPELGPYNVIGGESIEDTQINDIKSNGLRFSGMDLLPPPQQYLQIEQQNESNDIFFRQRRLSMISIENTENENYFRRDDLRRQSMPVFLKKDEYARNHSRAKTEKPAMLREEKEIFIDFKPNLLLSKPQKAQKVTKCTANTYENFSVAYKDCPCTVASVTNSTITSEDENNDPFYENVSFEPSYVNKSMKYREQVDKCPKQDPEKINKSETASVTQSPTRINVSTYPSSDSLANDTREYSDGIWNESQVTVLTVENRDINDEESFHSNLLITPSTKRKKLLLQHQQRSSVDTEALELEDGVEHMLSPSQPYAVESTSTLQVPTKTHTPIIAVTQVGQAPKVTVLEPPRTPTKILPELQKTDISLTRNAERKSSYSFPSDKECSRINADVSECSTNTDDYGTCTDNSKRTPGTKTSTTTTSSSSTTQVPASTQSSQLDKTNENSSFESASSLYSVREEISIDDALQKDTSLLGLFPEKACIDMLKRSPTHSLSSVSSGSYNIARLMGVSPLRTQAQINESQQRISPTSILKVTEKVAAEKPESPSDEDDDDDDHSLHPCSSSGYYESPQKDDKNLARNKMHARTEDERKRRKTIIKQNIEKENMRALTSPMKMTQYTASKTTSQRLSSPPTLEICSPTRMKRSRPKLRRHLRKQLKDGTLSNMKTEESTETELAASENREKLLDLIISDKSVVKIRSPVLTDAKKLKAKSIESLCSVSPGSDSVFYSETDGGNVESQSQCFNCGKDIEGSTSMISALKNDSIESLDNIERDIEQDIVKPPSDFADSPITIKTIQRLYKKINKKYRSEDRYHERGRHFKNRQENIRAKSEERNKENQWRSSKNLRSSGSSPSVLPDLSFEQNQQIVYRAHYHPGRYIHLTDADVWAQLNVEKQDQKRTRSPSTDSEKAFCIKYQVILHRLIQRRCTLEMYHRQKTNTFNVDKTVTVKRASGEFGFRIHGSKPVVVAAIEANTPAESSGLEVGDILISVNGIKVLDKHHTEVVKIAQDGCDSLELEVARTMGVLINEQIEEASHIIFSGYLWRQSSTSKKWVRRWFSLRKDHCLYYYKSEQDNYQPLGVLLLNHSLIEEDTTEIGKPFAFKIKTDKKKSIQLAADTEEMKNQWIGSIKQSALEDNTWLDVCAQNIYHPPESIQKADCQGYLFKLGPRWSGWSQRYCVLKEACMFFYQDAKSHSAFGMICLHGYKVASISANSAGKKNAFELIPPDPKLRHYYFSTESDSDKKRWISALEYSIDRWISSG